MADIVLAECQGRAWLVSGEQYIDDLLANTLSPEISIELVSCESKSEVDALWVQHCGPPEPYTAPWLIHPGIADRVRRKDAHHAVFFAQWSAMLDEDAQRTIKSVAIWAGENPELDVACVRFLPPDAAGASVELANLRSTVIETELAAQGVDRGRMVRETRDAAGVPSVGADSQRLDVILQERRTAT